MEQLIITETNNGDDFNGSGFGFRENDILFLAIPLFLNIVLMNAFGGFLSSLKIFLPIDIIIFIFIQIRKICPKGYEEDLIDEMISGFPEKMEPVKYEIEQS